MELIKGKQYLYTNIVKVGRQCKKTKKQLFITYVGTEGNKEVFTTESGIEILLHVNDIEKFLSETE